MPEDLIAGRYRLLEPLGRGSMSAVWLAHDDELDRRVAVKTLAPSADRERFAREARAVAALSHPNICALYDYGEDGGRPYMVLEYFPNGSLEDRLRAGRPLPDGETQRIASEIAAGLAHAHARGLVHRDLKPANILFDSEERAKIADFGIASMAGTGTLTDAGTVLGTASYISPEQATGLPAGPPSDVYSFGVILFRMLTGRLPFVSANAMELVRRHRDDPPPPVGAFRGDAPPRLEALVAESLRKDPRERPADGAALFARLREDDGETMATMVLPRAPRRPHGAVVPLVALAIALPLAGAGLAIALTRGGGNDAPPPPSLSLPSVSSTTPATTTAPAATTAPTTTHETTAAPTTTAPLPPPPTTFPTTTAPTTTALPPTTTVAPPPTTTDTTPTTTAPDTTTVDTTTDTTPTTTG